MKKKKKRRKTNALNCSIAASIFIICLAALLASANMARAAHSGALGQWHARAGASLINHLQYKLLLPLLLSSAPSPPHYYYTQNGAAFYSWKTDIADSHQHRASIVKTIATQRTDMWHSARCTAWGAQFASMPLPLMDNGTTNKQQRQAWVTWWHISTCILCLDGGATWQAWPQVAYTHTHTHTA